METAIQVTHLKKYFQEIKAVDDISFSVAKGEFFGFLGINGAGKSTTINMLCTLLAPTDGEAWVNGLKIGKDNEKIKKHIGVVYQNNCLDNLLTVKENLMLRGSLYEENRGRLKENLAFAAEILDLKEALKRPFGRLSGGQKRRCEIARALMHTPDILFLDEPTTGLDPATRKSVWQAVHTLQKEMGMTVFLTTHYMEEAAKADHIGIMSHGQFVEYGTPFTLKETYAKDKLYLIPLQDQWETIQSELKKRQLNYSQREEGILVSIENTMSALDILDGMRQRIQGFEVIQGTMDDVFLNVTKEDGNETVC